MFATEDKHRRHLDITYSRKFYMVHTVSQWTHKHRNFARKLRRLVNIEVKMVNGSRYYRALESVVSIASTLSTALTIYPSPSNADSLKLQLSTAQKKEWRPATADSSPQAITCQHCDTHYRSRPRTRNLPIVGPTRYQYATETTKW